MRIPSGSQLSLARPQITFQALLQRRKFPELVPDGGDFGPQQVTHVRARAALAAPEDQKLANLG